MSFVAHGGGVAQEPALGLRGLRVGPLAHAALGGGGRGGQGATGPGVVVAAGLRATVLRTSSSDLVSVLPAGAPLHPWAVNAPCDPAALRPGATVRLECGAATDLGLRRRLRRPPSGAAARALRTAAEDEDCAASPEPFIPILARALGDFEADGSLGPLAETIGLGEGLTPSGDDLLLGMLAGLDLLSDLSPRARADRHALRRLLGPRQLARTTPLSSQMVRAACEGLYPEPLLEVLRALADRRQAPGRLARAIAGLAGVGHRSGRAMLWGLATAVSAGETAERPDVLES